MLVLPRWLTSYKSSFVKKCGSPAAGFTAKSDLKPALKPRPAGIAALKTKSALQNIKPPGYGPDPAQNTRSSNEHGCPETTHRGHGTKNNIKHRLKYN